MDEQEEKVVITFRVPVSLRRRVRLEAARRGASQQQIVNDALDSAVPKRLSVRIEKRAGDD